MNRRIIFIILAALAFAVVVGLVWFWFFRGGASAPATGGAFGSGADKPAQTTGGSTGSNNNQPSNVLPNGQSGNTSSQDISISGGGGSTVGGFGSSSVQTVPGVATVPGVDWLGGGSGGIQTTNFVPKQANQLNDGSVGGSPGLFPSGGGPTGGDSGNGSGFGLGGILGAGAGCALQAAFKGVGEGVAGAEGGAALAGGFVLVYDWRSNSKQATKEAEGVGDCLARTIGKAVIQQMTNSIVNWINSGFNGQPSFVTNFEQFFTNVGDQAAGEFIRGSALSFLCSPFKLQIRVAIAQSYARRNNAGSCTLSGVVRNVNSFMNGNFSQGGWGGLIQYTTVPTNNPYGAYAYAQAGLVTAQNRATTEARNNLSPGGFISLKKCTPADSKNPKDCKVVTPGEVIKGSLQNTLEQPFLANQLAQSFDQIVAALLNQLVTKTLYNGLSSLSGSNGYAADYLTPAQQQAQIAAQALLTDMQGRLQTAQQYGSVQQGSVQDIQNTQQQLHTLVDCWVTKEKFAQASSTEEVIRNYDATIDIYNNNITRANAGIAALQDFQTQIININSAADVDTVTAAYNRALNTGVILTFADVTTAQQDRTTLQASLATRNQLTSTELNQCLATPDATH